MKSRGKRLIGQPGRRGAPPWLWLVVALAAAVVAAGREAVRRASSVIVSGRAEVIDGDSLRIGGTELRLAGIDAPEYRQTCWRAGAPEPCGRHAREALAALLAKGDPTCRVEGHDRFGRGLARCMVGRQDVNRTMVEKGEAVSFGDYETAQAQARAAGRGIWGTEFQRPADWRAAHPRDP
ncbi:MAG: thermonuclease family protein [Alsobacter sp.]